MRASRLLSLLLLLQARGRLTAAELARELEVSERTIYRDIAHLESAGVPMVAEPGVGGGYVLMEGYRTQLTGLTAEEAGMILLTGAPAAAVELGLGTALAAARLKLLAAVPPRLRDVAARAEQCFHLDPGGWPHQAPRGRRLLTTIADAVWAERELRIVHARPGEAAVIRTVAPLGLVHKTGSWYLVASRAGETRVYRVDRIREARPTGAATSRPDNFDLAGFWAGWERRYAEILPTMEVHVRLGPVALRYRDSLGPLSPRRVADEVMAADGWAVMTLWYDDVGTAAASLLALAPEVEVIHPAEVADRIADLAEEMLGRHRPDRADAGPSSTTSRSSTPRSMVSNGVEP